MRKNHRRPRRGVYVSPVLIAAGVLIMALGIILITRALGGEENGGSGGQSQETQTGQTGQSEQTDPDTQTPGDTDEKPEHVTTASGVACTLTELGEEAIYTGDLILVNNWTLYHFPEDQELVSIYEEKTGSYYVRDMEVYLSPVAMDALNAMLDDFRAQGGSKSVNVVAGYRTEEDQQHLFDQSAERNGLSHAEKYVAQPGGSEHHTGLVVDFSILNGDGTSRDYDGTGEYAWINEHCPEYGFIVRYDQAKAELTGINDEPWHFRYVGQPHAHEIAAQGLCLEEYIDYLRQFTFQGEHLTIQCGQGTYEVWYTEGTEGYLPDSGEYAVSGNNVDGVIVTCKIA